MKYTRNKNWSVASEIFYFFFIMDFFKVLRFQELMIRKERVLKKIKQSKKN